MAIVARSQQQMTQEEKDAVRTFFRDHPELGEGVDTDPTEQLTQNATVFEDYLKKWGVVINAESLQQAYENLRAVENVLKITSEAKLKYAEATRSYTQGHQDVLDAFLKQYHLVSDPQDDKTYENCTAIFNAMRGRDWTAGNLRWCVEYLQGRGTKLHFEDRSRPKDQYGRFKGTSPRDFVPSLGDSSGPGPGLVSHASNPRFNGAEERAQREVERQRWNPDAKIDADIALANRIWSAEIAKAVAEGRTHSERERIAQVAQQAPGGPRLQAAAAAKEAALIRQERERSR